MLLRDVWIVIKKTRKKKEEKKTIYSDLVLTNSSGQWARAILVVLKLGHAEITLLLFEPCKLF
jgi:hypothetical protein